VESDIRYYNRRAWEELSAASRAVTEAARERRLQLVDLYVRRLTALEAPRPFTKRDVDRALGQAAHRRDCSLFAWPGTVESEHS
jgi:hypothetical protein